MENKLKKLEKELSEIKIYTMVQAKIQKEMLMEIKQLRREINGHFRRKRLGKDTDRKSKQRFKFVQSALAWLR